MVERTWCDTASSPRQDTLRAYDAGRVPLTTTVAFFSRRAVLLRESTGAGSLTRRAGVPWAFESRSNRSCDSARQYRHTLHAPALLAQPRRPGHRRGVSAPSEAARFATGAP